MKLRLLYLTAETFPTYRVDVNILFGKYLPRYGIHSDIVAGKTPGLAEPGVWGGGEAYLCDVSGGPTKKHLNTFIHSIKHLFKADVAKYQAIQVRDMPLLATIGLLVARYKGLKFFYWMSFPMPDDQIIIARDRGLSEGLMKFLFPWVSGRVGCFLLYRIILPKADHAFVQSVWMKDGLTKRGICPTRMTPVPMGVDMDVLQKHDIVPVDDSRLLGKRVIVYLGRVDRARRLETLFEMLVIIKRQFPDVVLVMVGDVCDDVQRRWYKMKVDEAGVNDDIIWTGWLPIYDAWRYLRVAKVGLSPITRSHLFDLSSPTKIIEYLALGVPVVCNDNPDQNLIIRQTRAGISVPYTAESFAEAVIKILNLDESDWNEMGRKGKDYVNQYRDYQQIGINVADAYRKLLLRVGHNRNI